MSRWWEKHDDWSRLWELRLGDSEEEQLAHKLALCLEKTVIAQCEDGTCRPEVVVIPATRKTMIALGSNAKQPVKAIKNALDVLLYNRTESGPGSSGIVHFYLRIELPRKGLRPSPGYVVAVGYELMPYKLWPSRI